PPPPPGWCVDLISFASLTPFGRVDRRRSWPRAAERAWARAFIGRLPSGRSADGAYVNFLDSDDDHRRPAAFAPGAHARLTRLQERFDPDGVFAPGCPVRPGPDSATAPVTVMHR
ncbi:MAG: BBE domain-containing protein, partial [Acidimicrobiia bacterium]